jgi:prepilin-type N-terminal cleavage/methylation domain-containing protein
MLRRLGRRLAGRDGYTLVELIAVLAIFLTVLTPLVTLFTAGINAETGASRRFDAQQNARLALDRLRRELHCSDGITASATSPTTVNSITVSLPSQCPSAAGVTTSVVYDTHLVSTNRWTLRRTKGGVTVVIADYITAPSGSNPATWDGKVFSYTPQSSSSRGLLHVDIPVNVNPNEGSKSWRLVDDIVLRNTLRQ